MQLWYLYYAYDTEIKYLPKKSVIKYVSHIYKSNTERQLYSFMSMKM